MASVSLYSGSLRAEPSVGCRGKAPGQRARGALQPPQAEITI